jgi:hypothetical protein
MTRGVERLSYSTLTVTAPRSHAFVRAYMTSVVDTQAASAAGSSSCGAGALPSPPSCSGSFVIR